MSAWQNEYIDPAALHTDPVAEFGIWFAQAQKTESTLPEAMSLATVDSRGQPTSRMVLLQHFTRDGFVFFTNFDSDKGRHIAANPAVALLFHWKSIYRQVRIEGMAHRLDAEQSKAYWDTRPRGSRLAAWASRQSRLVDSTDLVEQRLVMLEEQYSGEEIPLPSFWGGYRVVPQRFEFWLSRRNRLHDRFCYEPDGNDWKIAQLQP